MKTRPIELRQRATGTKSIVVRSRVTSLTQARRHAVVFLVEGLSRRIWLPEMRWSILGSPVTAFLLVMLFLVENGRVLMVTKKRVVYLRWIARATTHWGRVLMAVALLRRRHGHSRRHVWRSLTGHCVGHGRATACGLRRV